MSIKPQNIRITKSSNVKSWNDKELVYIKQNAAMLEMTLESYGLQTRVIEVNALRDEYEFCLEIAIGTHLEKILSLRREIALALASPTGDVRIKAPIPGRVLIGVYLPKQVGRVEKKSALVKYLYGASSSLFRLAERLDKR